MRKHDISYDRGRFNAGAMTFDSLVEAIAYLKQNEFHPTNEDRRWNKREQGDFSANTYALQKPELQSFPEGGIDAIKRLQSRFPSWLAVLVFALIFGSIPVTWAVRSIHRFQINNQILEASTITETAKVKVARYPEDNALPAPDNAAVGLPEPAAIRSRYVTSLEVRNGTIIVTLGAQAAKELQGKHLLFTFTREQYNMARWHCTSADIARSLHPIACM